MYHTWQRYKMHTKFWSEYLKERDHLEDTGIGGRIISEWQGVDWIYLVQDRVQLWALVNVVMNEF
jgi:hypothetical protein